MFRAGLIGTMLLSPGLIAISDGCFPLINLNDRPPTGTATTLAIAILAPTQSRSVPIGTAVPIQWTATSLGDDEAIVTIVVEQRTNLAQSVVAGGIRLTGGGLTQTTLWDTSSFVNGEYAIRARIERGGLLREATAEGRITVNERPEFEFTEPTEDTTFDVDPNSDAQIIIRWRSRDLDDGATARVGLDTDEDHESGNEIELVTRTLAGELVFDSFRFVGNDGAGEPVPEGTYFIYALVDDEINPKLDVRAQGRIIIPERPEEPEPVKLEITEPPGDRGFLETDAPLEIVYTIDEDDDVLVDLRIDQDDNHANGNEITILADRLIKPETREDRFQWNGRDVNGALVPRGIYRVLLVVNRGDGSPETVESRGFIFRRAATGQPLISLLTPATNTTVDAGSLVNITWRDDTGVPDQEADDPNAPLIRLAIDDDPNPLPAHEDGEAEITILSNRNAVGDGVQDTFLYTIPLSLNPGTYYIHAYIGRPGQGDFETPSTLAGRIIVRDPNSQ